MEGPTIVAKEMVSYRVQVHAERCGERKRIVEGNREQVCVREALHIRRYPKLFIAVSPPVDTASEDALA